MRAVIYARYSSDLQSDASIEDQIRLCRARIKQEGWSYLHAYHDRAASGASRLRPGYQKLLEDARNGEIDVVVAEALDRLSRDQEDVAHLYKQLNFSGITLFTLVEGEVCELHVGLKGTMNALYLKDLAQKTRRGLEGRVRHGKSGGGNAYGYDIPRKFNADGERIRGDREINEMQAAVIRRIFEEFAVGKSPRAIARALNTDGVPGPGGRPWLDTTIRGHVQRRTGILRNDLYVGRLIWNKQRYLKDPQTGKRLARPNPETEWIVHDVPELRIVPQDLWDRVQARLKSIEQSPSIQKARATGFWKHRRPKHLLTGIAKCGKCGGNLTTAGKNYLGCSPARRMGTCENRATMPRSKLEDLILDAFRQNLMAPDLVKEFTLAFHDELKRQRQTQLAVHHDLERQLNQAQKTLDGLIDAMVEGFRAPDLQQRLDALTAHRDAIKTQLSEEAKPVPVLHPNLAELYRRKIKELHVALKNPDIGDEAFTIMRGMIEQITVTPAEKGFDIEIVGDIARMVEVANRDILSENQRCSVKVVAGGRI